MQSGLRKDLKSLKFDLLKPGETLIQESLMPKGTVSVSCTEKQEKKKKQPANLDAIKKIICPIAMGMCRLIHFVFSEINTGSK